MKNSPSSEKPVIYQLFVRLFGNKNCNNLFYGKIEENGCGKFNDITNQAILSVKELGVTHIWLTGVVEHAVCNDYSQNGIVKDNFSVIKGRAGSPYAIKNYYNVNPDLAENVDNRMMEFEELIARCHQNGVKVIIDFVPNHVARSYSMDTPEGVVPLGKNDDITQAFSPQNNFYYIPGEKLNLPEEVKNLPYVDNSDIESYIEFPAKVTGNDCFSSYPSFNDWYETVKLNYGIDYLNHNQCFFDPIPDTWTKMANILLYWKSKGVDGFRCDMAEMVPAEFWNFAISKVKSDYPDTVFIAEIYNPNAYHNYIETGNFDYLYDKEGLYNTLRNVIEGKAPTRMITQCWQSLNGLDDKMLRFIENHDEQRLASKYFAGNYSSGIPAMTLCTAFNKGPVMIYFGQELGETAEGAAGFSGDDGRTTIFDYYSVPSVQKWNNNGLFDGGGLDEEIIALRKKYSQILRLAERPEIMSGHFYDLMWYNADNQEFDGNSVYAFLRHLDQNVTLIVLNFSKDKSVRVRVKIPPDFFDIIGEYNYFDLFGKDILESGKMFTCDKQELLNNGIVLIMETNSAYAFELEFVKK
ncbi:MAG: alpha-amylase family protein [Bacteroidetes bacterium]|nr:alpha-amylase family protein [Bacteroidota bacterium]